MGLHSQNLKLSFNKYHFKNANTIKKKLEENPENSQTKESNIKIFGSIPIVNKLPTPSHLYQFKMHILENFSEYKNLQKKLPVFREGDLFERYQIFSFEKAALDAKRYDLVIKPQDGQQNGPVDLSIMSMVTNMILKYQMKFATKKENAEKAFRKKKYEGQNHVSNHEIPGKNIANKVIYEDPLGKVASEAVTTEDIKKVDKELNAYTSKAKIDKKLNEEKAQKMIKDTTRISLDCAASSFGDNVVYIDQIGVKQCLTNTVTQTATAVATQVVFNGIDQVIDTVSTEVPGIAQLVMIGTTTYKIYNSKNASERTTEIVKASARIGISTLAIILIPIPVLNVFVGSLVSSGLGRVIDMNIDT